MTISPNYPGEAFETPDLEVLVVSTDVPPQDGMTDEQRIESENTNAARVVRCQQGLAAAAPTAEQPPGNIGMEAPAAPAAPQPHQEGNEPHRNRLRARELLWDFEQDSHEVYNSPQANLGVALAALGQLEDTPTIQCLQAHIHVTTTQVEKRGSGYSRSAASSYSKSRSEHPHQRRRGNGPLEPVADEGQGENEVIQPVNPAANAAANAAANPPANAAANAAGNVTNNATNSAGAQPNIIANPRQNTRANLRRHKLITPK
jgi:hypothetical protein